MGFISNIAGTLSDSILSEIKDQYLEVFSTDSLGQNMLVKRAYKKNASGRNKGNVDVVSAGSRIFVPEGAYALMTDGGKVVDSVTEPGLYTWENSSSGSVLSGGIDGVFGDVFDRIKFGGEIPKMQRIYYVNALEIMNQTGNELLNVPYQDPFFGVLYFRFRITFSFRIVDPVRFFKITGKETSVYDLMGSSSSPRMPFMEVQDHMKEAFNLCAVRDKMSFPQFLANKSKLKDAVNEAVSKVWREQRGMVIASIALTDLTLDPDSRRRVEQFETNKIYADDPDALHALEALGLTDAFKAAGSNPRGAFSGFAGIGMASIVADKMGKVNTQTNGSGGNNAGNVQIFSGPEACPFCGTPLPQTAPLDYCPACVADIRPYYSGGIIHE